MAAPHIRPPRATTSPPDPLPALLTRIAARDELAFRTLYDSLSPRVFGLSLRILRDRATAEEAVIEVFSQVWRQAHRFDSTKASATTWILTLARTRSIDLARIHKRRTQREVEADPSVVETIPDVTAPPLHATADTERASLIRAALEQLPRDQRTAVELAFFSGLSHTEVAATLRTPLGTIKTRIRTGLGTLRVALAGMEGEL